MAIARPTHRRLFVVFDRAHGLLSRAVTGSLASLGIRPAQATALIYLGYHDGCQLSELAEGVGSNNSAVTGLVDRMEKRRLVKRQKAQPDSRAKTVHLTATGRALRGQVMQILRKTDEKLIARFSDTELDTIYRFLLHAGSLH